MKFEEFSLDPRILAGINSMGFVTPTPIQQQSIPVVLEGRDVLGVAQTGTGKTAAFVLPILQRLVNGRSGKVRALVLAPTRELAEQIHEHCVQLGGKTKIRSTTIYGGVSKGPQLSALRRGVEIVVACPGRLLDHIGEGAIDLSNVDVLVLDEADRMCDMGFLPDIRRILKHVPAKRQTLFFSATMPTDIRRLADSILTNPATVQIGMIAPAKTVSHAIYPVTNGQKKELLLAMLEKTPTGRVLIFTRTKRRARNLALDLNKRRYRVAALQGNMSQNARQRAIDGFRSGKHDILVATDVASRGIDVAEISHVINFDMPDTVDAYTHRIGRTGRAKEAGDAFSLTSPDDERMIREIEKLLGSSIERRSLADFNYGSFVPTENGGRSYAQPSAGNRSSSSRSSSSRSTRGNGKSNSSGKSQSSGNSNGNGKSHSSDNSNGNGSSNGKSEGSQQKKSSGNGNGQSGAKHEGAANKGPRRLRRRPRRRPAKSN